MRMRASDVSQSLATLIANGRVIKSADGTNSSADHVSGPSGRLIAGGGRNRDLPDAFSGVDDGIVRRVPG